MGQGRRILLDIGLLLRTKLGRLCALEGIDRLFLIPHHEQGTRVLLAFGADARGEFFRQRIDQLPLFWAGILCFIEQYVTDSSVQFVKYPVGHAGPGEQVTCLADKVVEIERAATTLLFLVCDQRIQPDFQQSGGALYGLGQLQLRRERLNARHF